MIIYRTRRLKYLIICGTCLFMMAYGLVLYFRGGTDGGSKAGVITAQILLGLAGGFFAYPTQASVQAATTHEHMAVLTGIYLGSFNIGSALGTCVSGAIWTQTLYKSLVDNLAFQSNTTLAHAVYDSPFEVVPFYPIGTPERSAIILSYRHVQRLLCVTGICLATPMIALAFVLRNPKLSKEQSQPEAERED
jgi:SIT family siderophore-iron:H+ symporter-like MFS transporter